MQKRVPMNADDIAKTAIVAPFGLFEYLRMPFGLKNAAQTCQRFMDNVFRDMQFVYVYLDDILVVNSSIEEHCIHLRQLFERLAEYRLVVNTQKCVLGQSSLYFLGHRVTSDGVHPLQDRVQAISDYPQPCSAKSLKEYLGLLNFYRRFVTHAAAILLPLYELGSLKDTEFCAAWTSLHEKHYQQSKDALSRPYVDACVLAFLVIAATGRRNHTQVELLCITRRIRTIFAFPINSERLDASVFTSMLPGIGRKSRTCATRATDVIFERKHCSRRRRHTQVEKTSPHKQLGNSKTITRTRWHSARIY